MEDTYIRVGGRWRYLWRAVDANGQIVDFRLTARRDTKAARAFLNKAIERVRLHRPVTIVTDKTQAYRHIDRKWRKNLVDGDHAALRRLFGYRQSFRSLRTGQATLSGVETIRTIKRDHIHHKKPSVMGELAFMDRLFESTA